MTTAAKSYDLNGLRAIGHAIDLALKADEDTATVHLAAVVSSMEGFTGQFLDSYSVQPRQTKRLIHDARGDLVKSIDETETLVHLRWRIPALGKEPNDRVVTRTLEPAVP